MYFAAIMLVKTVVPLYCFNGTYTMVVNIKYYFTSLDLTPKWLICDRACVLLGQWLYRG